MREWLLYALCAVLLGAAAVSAVAATIKLFGGI